MDEHEDASCSVSLCDCLQRYDYMLFMGVEILSLFVSSRCGTSTYIRHNQTVLCLCLVTYVRSALSTETQGPLWKAVWELTFELWLKHRTEQRKAGSYGAEARQIYSE